MSCKPKAQEPFARAAVLLDTAGDLVREGYSHYSIKDADALDVREIIEIIERTVGLLESFTGKAIEEMYK